MRKRLVKDKDGKFTWIEIGAGFNKVNNVQGEDLTVEGYINKYGGIESSVDGKVYTSKHSYLDHLKENNCTIKDW